MTRMRRISADQKDRSALIRRIRVIRVLFLTRPACYAIHKSWHACS
jgi:hypothetical protein